MHIVFDGRVVESLAPKVARRIARRIDRAADSPPLVEGVIVSADQITADTARRTKVGFGVVVGVAAAILIVTAIMAIGYEPGVMVVVGPLYLVILAAMGWGAPWLYRRSMARFRDKIARRLARTAPAGTAVRLDGAGLTFGGRATPWSDIALEAVEVVTEYHPDSEDDYSIQAVLLDMGGQSVILDEGVITHGSAIVAKALRTLGYPEKGAKEPRLGGD